MKFPVILDTNILVSALWTKGGTATKIIDITLMSTTVYYSEEILEEYLDVLTRKKFKDKFSVSEVDILLARISANGILFATPTPSTIPLPDESDRIFLRPSKIN